MTRNPQRAPHRPGGPDPRPSRRVGLARARRALLVVVLSTAFMATARGVVLETGSTLTVKDADVRLQDIVINPATLPETWRSRIIMPAPAPGAPQQYPLAALARGLKQYGDMANVRLQGPPTVTINRAGVAVTLECITSTLETFVKTHAPWKDLDVIVRCPPLEKAMAVPTNARPPVVTLCEPAAQPNRYRFTLAIDTGGPEDERVPVYADIQPATRVWVAARDLARGHLLSAGDLTSERLPTAAISRYMPTATTVDGMELIRPLRAGQRLEPHTLAPPMCARQGEPLDVTVQHGSLQVLMHTKALAAGRKDERIFCLNESSGNRLSVRLTGNRQATVDY